MKRALVLLIVMASSTGSAGCGGPQESPSASTPAPMSEPPTSEAAPAEQREAAPTEQREAAPAEQREAAPAEQREAAPAEQREAAPTEQSATADALDGIASEPKPEPPPPPAAVASPNGDVTFGSVSVSGARVSDAMRVVASMRAYFRMCYKKSLNNDPETRGSLHLTLNINANGNVRHVDAAPSGRLPQDLVQCVRRRSQRAWFAMAGGAARVSVPVTFAPR